MTDQTLTKLHELKGTLEARSTIAQSDANRAEATRQKMRGEYNKGYYQAEHDTHSQYVYQLTNLIKQVLDIIEEAENA